jgi:hypothetical protein
MIGFKVLPTDGWEEGAGRKPRWLEGYLRWH